MGNFYDKKGKKLIIDDDTALWVMRMIVGEGGKHCSKRKAEAIFTAMINRWFLWPGARHYKTFTKMIRAFSQPINPRWMTGGDLAKKYIGRSAASAERLERRAKICAMQVKNIPIIIFDTVNAVRNGVVENKFNQRISNWASLKSTPVKYPWGFYIDDDWFFEDDNLKPGKVFYNFED